MHHLRINNVICTIGVNNHTYGKGLTMNKKIVDLPPMMNLLIEVVNSDCTTSKIHLRIEI